MDDFSKYLNPPVCPVSVGDTCIREDYLLSETKYFVKEIFVENSRWYAMCQYEDEFSGELQEEKVYAYNLKRA